MYLKDRIVSIIDKLARLFNRYYKYFPYLSLFLGILTILLWERGFDFIRWVFMYLIFIGITTLLFLRFVKYLPHENKFFSIAVWCVEFINQNLYQDLIFFLLPIYYQSSTLFSKNVVFLIIIAVLGIITTFDNVYRILILRNRITQFLFYAFNLFAFLNFCLPVLFGIRNIYSLYISIAAAVLLLTPIFIDYRELFKTTPLTSPLHSGERVRVRGNFIFSKTKAGLVFAAMLLSLLTINMLKDFIPPVPLKIVFGTASVDIDRVKREPVTPFSAISSKGLEAIYCYTSIFAPMGIKENLWHVWKRDGIVVQRVRQDITGGRKEGYRTWSRRTAAGNNTAGAWTVDVETGGGQLIGRVRFKITD